MHALNSEMNECTICLTDQAINIRAMLYYLETNSLRLCFINYLEMKHYKSLVSGTVYI